MMKWQKHAARDLKQLRQHAEQMLTNQPASGANIPVNDKRLLHELQVHQIELEMLNENLRQAQLELEKSWARYYDLYELAPVGYLSLNDHDLIVDANQTASKLLDKEKKFLLGHTPQHVIFADD